MKPAQTHPVAKVPHRMSHPAVCMSPKQSVTEVSLDFIYKSDKTSCCTIKRKMHWKELSLMHSMFFSGELPLALWITSMTRTAPMGGSCREEHWIFLHVIVPTGTGTYGPVGVPF